MIAGMDGGAFVRFETLIAAVIEAAARAYGAAPFGVCCVDLADEDGRRFALALHKASPAALDPASFTAEGAAPLWCRTAPLGRVVPVVASMLGAEMRDAVASTHRAGAVPVVIVADGVAMVSAFERPPGAS